MTRRRWALFLVLLALCIALVAAAGVAIYQRLDGMVDRESYAAGWQYVVQRQPREGIAFGPNYDIPAGPATDLQIVEQCRWYEREGLAELDGVYDQPTFVRGCEDAALRTTLEETR